MTPQEILIAAKAKIADPSRWTQGANARDCRDRNAPSKSPVAVRWCSEGAVLAVSPRWEANKENRYLDLAARELGWAKAYLLNDADDHSMVMRMFDRAIELAGAV